MTDTYDVIVVGTGISGSFFLHNYLSKAHQGARILVLERGQKTSHQSRMQRKTSNIIPHDSTFINRTPEKPWVFQLGFGGSSNMWWACTPRMMPNDFKLKSTYGVGTDWPVSYDELEPYYTQAEIIMAVSGPDDGSPYPRSQPYPQPPHRFSDPDLLLKKAYPDLYFQQASARSRVPTANRPLCCASGVCSLCPIDSKFTVLNEMSHLYQDSRVTVLLGSEALAVETAGGSATGVRYLKEGTEQMAKADLIVLGANAIFNPYLLQRSDLNHPLLGKRLSEQVSVGVRAYLDGVDNYQGSTSISANGYMLYDGPHRSQHAACMIEVRNVPVLRVDKGRWRQISHMKFIFENLPRETDRVMVSEKSPHLPETVHHGHSDYAQKAMDTLPEVLPKILAPLPIERIDISEPSHSEAHILGTTMMGNDPTTSIVDKHLVHHQIRNLMVLGGSAFPTSAPANPTLTIAALTLWAADHL